MIGLRQAGEVSAESRIISLVYGILAPSSDDLKSKVLAVKLIGFQFDKALFL